MSRYLSSDILKARIKSPIFVFISPTPYNTTFLNKKMSEIDQIKNKIDIVDLISEYVQLKRAGGNWRANCPFHHEKTPSFMVSPQRQIWHCFGCNKGGDIFGFIQEIEGIEFYDALKLLAKRTGVVLKQQNPQVRSQKAELQDLNEMAAKVFNHLLYQHEEAKPALEYLKEKRRLTDETIKNWQLGYSLNKWDALLKFLKAKNFKNEQIFNAGLAVKKDNGDMYDRFRNRIMFPLKDVNGQNVGFTARVLPGDDEGMGKYINTPQTLIYNKSFVLFGLDQAKMAIKENDRAVIVEGNMDVIASNQAGVKEVVAQSGTALTIEQINIIKRYTDNIVFSLDEDQAGQLALDRGVALCLQNELNIKIVQLPKEINGTEIKDPDDCIRVSVEAWKKAIDTAIPVMEYYFEKIFNKYDFLESQGQKKIADELLEKIAYMNNRIEQSFWLQKLADRLNVKLSLINEEFEKKVKIVQKNTSYNSNDSKQQLEPQPEKQLKKQDSREEVLSKEFLALVINFPVKLSYAVDNLLPDQINNEKLSQLYKILILYYNREKGSDFNKIREFLIKEAKELEALFNALIIYGEEKFVDFTENDPNLEKELRYLIKEIKKVFIQNKLKSVETELKASEARNDKEQVSNLLRNFSELKSELENFE